MDSHDDRGAVLGHHRLVVPVNSDLGVDGSAARLIPARKEDLLRYVPKPVKIVGTLRMHCCTTEIARENAVQRADCPYTQIHTHTHTQTMCKASAC